MTQTAWAPGRVVALPVDAPVRPDIDDAPAAATHRWWRVALREGVDGLVVAALVGCRASVVWAGSVALVPCSRLDGEVGMCPCGLHAPATASEMARALGSIAIGGHVRVLGTALASSDAEVAVVALHGPLRMRAWCGGSQDGFTVDRCDRRPRWVVRGPDAAAALCTRHLLRLPRPSRADAMTLKRFTRRIANTLRRYGVEVFVGDAVGDVQPIHAVAPIRWSTGTPLSETQRS